MLQILGLAFILALPTLGSAQPVIPETTAPSPSAEIQQTVDRIWTVLQLEQLMPLLRDEALAEAPEMAQSMFPRGGTGNWTEQVAAIHEPASLRAAFREGIGAELREEQLSRVNAALDFYQTELGQRLVTLETTTRQALLDSGTEEAARETFARAIADGDPRAQQINRFIHEADLIGPNVSGGLNAAIAFSEGFAAGDGFDMPMSRDEMIADAWAQEADIAAETLTWMQAYLMLAYSPLSDDELESYIRFSTSPEGVALAAVMFRGFDRIFVETSRALGLAAARQLQGREL
jgi:hypothetical protein